ncbi:MAG: hypothetical protein RLZZ303_1112 [Candidatus Hydrogenedentota bacterium]|jgi:hypothetical protein
MSKHSSIFAVLLALGALVPCGAYAHTVFLFLEIEDDGRLRIETGFSDGGTGAGLPVEIRDAASGEVLETVTMPEDGVTHAVVPGSPYTVVLDAGEGHRVTKPGPQPKAAAAPAKPQIVDCSWGDAAQMSEGARTALQQARVVLGHAWLFERLRPLFTNQTVALVNADVPLNAESNDETGREAAELRTRVRERIQQAIDAGAPVAILSATLQAPDWRWLVDEGLAVHLEPAP